MRNLLRKELESIDAPGDWSHVTTQIGMFSFTGLSPAQSDLMVKKHHIYMTKDGRISISCCFIYFDFYFDWLVGQPENVQVSSTSSSHTRTEVVTYFWHCSSINWN